MPDERESARKDYAIDFLGVLAAVHFGDKISKDGEGRKEDVEAMKASSDAEKKKRTGAILRQAIEENLKETGD